MCCRTKESPVSAWRSNKAGGFTLIEVLVALAIVSIALMAALRAAGQGTNSAGELRASTLASWVAQNRLAEHRARGDWLPLGLQRGHASEGGIMFDWREEVIATPNAAFRRINVTVYAASDASHVLSRFSGFLVNPPPAGP